MPLNLHQPEGPVKGFSPSGAPSLHTATVHAELGPEARLAQAADHDSGNFLVAEDGAAPVAPAIKVGTGRGPTES